MRNVGCGVSVATSKLNVKTLYVTTTLCHFIKRKSLLDYLVHIRVFLTYSQEPFFKDTVVVLLLVLHQLM